MLTDSEKETVAYATIAIVIGSIIICGFAYLHTFNNDYIISVTSTDNENIRMYYGSSMGRLKLPYNLSLNIMNNTKFSLYFIEDVYIDGYILESVRSVRYYFTPLSIIENGGFAFIQLEANNITVTLTER